MKFLLLIITSLSCLCSAWASDQLSKEECKVIVKDLERMSNINPSVVEDKAPKALDLLRNGQTLSSYFIAYNIYIENLFNKGKINKAQLEMERMLNEAAAQTDPECKVIALRTQGQFYFKLGLYDRAVRVFREAMQLCPRYDSELLEHCFTWSSTLFWLVQSYIHTGLLAEAEYWLLQMDDMMQWLDSIGEVDHVGYKPVMISGLKAKIELARGNIQAANQLLDQCPQYMLPDVPSRAYVEYYVAKMLLCVHEGKHDEALPILDELIDIHLNDYKPIAAEYIYQKGLSLAALGKFDQSTQALIEYVDLKNRVNDQAISMQLDELNARYEVEKLQHERDDMQKKLLITLVICGALLVIFILIVIIQKKLQHKNHVLARNVSELNRLLRESQLSAKTSTVDDAQASNTDLVDIGNKIIDYINQTQCYLRPDCSRETIKEGIGVTEHTLAKAIVAATGLSFVNYINQLRLNASIEMLEDKPEMTINEISAACGFGTVRQFQRIFKQHYDLTPSVYREARNPKSPLPDQ